MASPSDTLSTSLGYMSIAMWLGAQFPQILTNIQRQSVDGLALPFLANWMLGDVSNLVGCILTEQLPFQTYLATYFCFVDICLVAQYIYYSPPIRFRKQPKELPDTPTETFPPRALSREPHLRRLSIAAANVAVAAAHEEGVLHRRAASISAARSPSQRRRRPSDAREATLSFESQEGEGAAALMESFHSDDSRPGKKVFWDRPGVMMTQHHPVVSRENNTTWPAAMSPILSGVQFDGPPLPPSPSTSRGRKLTRGLVIDPNLPPAAAPQPLEAEEIIGDETVMVETPADMTSSAAWRRSRSRRPPSASRRSASIVFLGVWALFGLGHWSGGRTDLGTRNWSGESSSVGKVLSLPNQVSSNDYLAPSHTIVYPTYSAARNDSGHPSHRHPPERRQPTLRHMIGRISAWVCTTLYLTSRLPQIWKNFARKSVEGLSMALFIFAFLGNTFYVLSILTNPMLQAAPPIRAKFIAETIPYLLGSGGTLLFDITIVTQSVIYKGKRPRSSSVYSGVRRRSVLRAGSGFGIGEEEEALLAPGNTEGAAGSGTHSGVGESGRRKYGSTSTGPSPLPHGPVGKGAESSGC